MDPLNGPGPAATPGHRAREDVAQGGTVEIWLNPECSKCRAAGAQLDAAGAGYTVRRYLDDPPSAAEIADVLGRLGLEPWDVTRLGEPAAVGLGLADWSKGAVDRERWIAALAANPTLLQRPIITAADGSAVLGRTPEAVDAALAAERSAASG